MAKKTIAGLEAELAEAKRMVANALEQFKDIVDQEDLCEDGKEIVKEMSMFAGVNRIVSNISLNIELAEFEVSPDFDEEDADSYKVIVRNKNGDEIEVDYFQVN